MKRLRIVATTTAAPKRPAPLPEDVERLLPYTTDAYAPLTAPVKSRLRSRRRSVVAWIGFGVLALSSFATLGLAIAILATRPGTPPTVQSIETPAPRLHAAGTWGGDTLNCLADDLRVVVSDVGTGDGVLVGTLTGPNTSFVFTLDPGTGGYTANVTADAGVLHSASAVRGQPMAAWPGETLLLQVDGVPGARRLRVTGGSTFSSWEHEVCQ